MNEIQNFTFDGATIQTLVINDEPYFIGKGVAEVLGYANTQKAIRDHVDAEDKLTERIVLSGQNRDVIVINESGLYSLILSSKLPEAKRFKRWVTSEVLPTIRKHGAYATAPTIDKILSDPDYGIQLLQTLKEERAKRIELEEQNTKMLPKAVFADAVATSDKTILIGDLAKLIRQNGPKVGQKRLFEWMRENGFLIKRRGADWNSPTQRAMEMVEKWRN
ncbi:BRO family protein [uncultured Dubosiella sp.]|uniref:phage antirepressor n=1 Tax=uncultured Dubosiella sp. TaxID=1937011 RepID=UPI0027318068|nr:BRO family protein [uncultured Dubosiella sp.]